MRFVSVATATHGTIDPPESVTGNAWAILNQQQRVLDAEAHAVSLERDPPLTFLEQQYLMRRD